MTPHERNLAHRYQRREPGGFEALYAQYGPRVYRFCHRLCGDPADAEDLTQDVFVAALRGAEGFQGRSSLATWLYRIALYQWRARRERRRWDGGTLDERHAAAGADPAEFSLTRLALDGALAALPSGQREAFLLVKAEGLTCREAAEVLGVAEGTLKYRVYEAVRRLQTLLAEEKPPRAALACESGGAA